MKRVQLVLFLLAFSFVQIFCQSDDICGYWRTVKGNAQIEVFKGADGKYAGKVVWLRIEKNRPDLNNANAALRNRKILGLQILQQLVYDARQKRWEKGRIYDPENGKTYDCIVSLTHNKDILTFKGYIPGLKMLGRESLWIRESRLRE